MSDETKKFLTVEQKKAMLLARIGDINIGVLCAHCGSAKLPFVLIRPPCGDLYHYHAACLLDLICATSVDARVEVVERGKEIVLPGDIDLMRRECEEILAEM